MKPVGAHSTANAQRRVDLPNLEEVNMTAEGRMTIA